MARWSAEEVGVIELPSGRSIRGRSLRTQAHTAADLALVLTLRRPADVSEQAIWIAWPDFGLPLDRHAAAQQLRAAWARSATERVEVACRGGRGRTGTALACLAVLDGVPPPAAVALVRQQYDHRAIETPWQERYVAAFDPHPVG